MLEEVHAIQVLEDAKKALKQDDTIAMKDLSNKTIHSASIYQDPDNVALAVVLYALSKLVERTSYRKLPGWKKFEKTYISSIDKAIIALKRKDIEVYRDQLGQVREAIKGLSGNLRQYVEDVFRKASINKASRLYEHGISLAKTASILGVTVWELNQYVGQTRIADVNLAYTRDLNSRIKLAERIFGK